MKKGRAFLKSDWFLGLVVVLVVLFLSRTDLMQSLEYKAYDLGVRASSKTPSDKIAIIAIDDASIARIGRWPWSREVHAKMIDILSGAHAKVIGETIFFSEPQRDPGLDYIDKLNDLYGKGTAANEAALSASPEWTQMGSVLKDAESNLDTDKQLGEAITRAGNVVLPVELELGVPNGRPDAPLPDAVAKFALPNDSNQGIQSRAIHYPVASVGANAAALGALSSLPGRDGAIRQEPLAISYYDKAFPSLALMIAASSLNLGVQDIHVGEDSVSLGRLSVRTDDQGSMLTHFYKSQGDKPAFQVDSFYDVLTGKIPADSYAGKIVLIGATAAGVGVSFPTPVSAAMAPVETLANSVSSILNEHFFVEPSWSRPVELLVVLLIALYIIILLPRLRAGLAAIVTAVLLVALLATHFALMAGPGIWLQLMLPVVLLVIGHLVLTTRRFLVVETGKDRSDSESAESNRMLGLAFQGQGQLDMAFDKFRKCPLDDALMDNLYNLALDFERKRQFNKAQSVYEYMSAYNPKFRDLENKLTRAKTMSETIILGGGGGGRSNASLLNAESGNVEKPMLGRYQVEKELGKGAMGVVYLGKDPKIGRVVAIKTMALSQEFEPDELQDVKERFFREAETAGRLNHPNIVTIFDAGEEHDLAYIAMEFLKGKDLVPYTKLDQLLPVERVVSIHARVAEALSYAHRQAVVHRDIKPANIMYELESDTVKVTDFGIARITDSSKTKTGMVLGTPSYMSPEQLSGMKIDGRSDLFSLAVSLYQMSCGRLPFVADSMAQLMYKIANEEAPDIRLFNDKLPDALVHAIHKGMAKKMEDRYQSGDEMAADLRAIFAAPGATTVGMPAVAAAVAPASTPAAPAAAVTAAPAAGSSDATVIIQAPATPASAAHQADAIKTVVRTPKPEDPHIKTVIESPDSHIKTVIDPDTSSDDTPGVDFEL